MDLLGLGSIGAGLVGAYASSKNAKLNYKAQQETNDINRQIATETNQANMQINREQLESAFKLQQMQNAYNSPVNQMSMLKSAGLNPALAFGDVSNVGAVGLPSSIPAQSGAPMQAPQMQYSDTFVSKSLDSILSAIAAQSGLADVKGKNIDNLTRQSENIARLEQYRANTAKLLAEKDLPASTRKVLEQQAKLFAQEYDMMKASADDIILSHKMQNDLTKSVIGVNEAQRESLTENALLTKIQQQLSLRADARAERELHSVLARATAEIRNLNANSSLSEKEYDERVQSWAQRYSKLVLENTGLRLSNKEVNEKLPHLVELLEYQAKTTKLDYKMAPMDRFMKALPNMYIPIK